MKNILIIDESRQATGEKLLNEIKSLITCPIGGYWIDINWDETYEKIIKLDLVSLYSGESENISLMNDDLSISSKINKDVFNNKGVQFLQDSLNNGEVLIFNEIGYLESKAEKFTKEVVRAFNSNKAVIALLKKVNCDYINYIATRRDVNIFNISEDNKFYVKEDIIKLLRAWQVPLLI